MLTKPDRVKFDVKNKEHLKSYSKFLKHGSWIKENPVPFFQLEEPYLSIPDMIRSKIAVEHLRVNLEDETIIDPIVEILKKIKGSGDTIQSDIFFSKSQFA